VCATQAYQTRLFGQTVENANLLFILLHTCIVAFIDWFASTTLYTVKGSGRGQQQQQQQQRAKVELTVVRQTSGGRRTVFGRLRAEEKKKKTWCLVVQA
jgi:hypothetical protein